MNDRTVIPDLHADPHRLEMSLVAAEGRHLAFLGDFIDAGKAVKSPNDAAVLTQVRELIESNRAVAVMGNHELNAILFHRKDRNGNPLREQSAKNLDQHYSFVDQFGLATPIAIHWTEWFLNLPLWVEKDGLRLVHACWDEVAIETIKERRSDGRLQLDDLEEVAAKETPFALAVETLTSGPEVRLPIGEGFHDIKGIRREHVRIAWWRANGGSWRDVALSVPDINELPDTEVAGAQGIPVYPAGQPPVLVGHYKMKGTPRIDVGQAACLDYPDNSCVYHWSGEDRLVQENIQSLHK